MRDLQQLLEWKLLEGSHEFPGPDGGTCVNEAAIVAAGLDYKPISSITDLPSIFSPILATFAMDLNDTFSDEARQDLMPFVFRLAGSADSAEIERRRFEHLFFGVIRHIATARERNLPHDVRTRFLRVRNCREAMEAFRGVNGNQFLADCEVRNHDILKLAMALSESVVYAYAIDDEKYCDSEAMNTRAIRMLDEAMAIGGRAPRINVDLVFARMKSAREAAFA